MAQVYCNLPTHMLSQIEIKEIEERVRTYNKYGSILDKILYELNLATSIPLEDAIRADNEYLKSVSITHEQIADVLEYMSIADYTKNDSTMAGSINLNNYKVRCIPNFGSVTCQFQNEKLDSKFRLHTSGDITIENKRTGQKIKFGSILIHQIRDHHFFRNVKPSDIIKMFDIKPNVLYKNDPQTHIPDNVTCNVPNHLLSQSELDLIESNTAPANIFKTLKNMIKYLLIIIILLQFGSIKVCIIISLIMGFILMTQLFKQKNLTASIAADSAYLKSIGVTHEQIAHTIETCLYPGIKNISVKMAAPIFGGPSCPF